MKILFLLGILVLVAIVWAIRSNFKLQSVLSKQTTKGQFPELVSVALLAVQASELVNIVNEASFANIIAAMITLAILLAVRFGTEGETH